MTPLRHGSGTRGVFASWLASPPPDAAIEIAPEAVSIAALGSRGAEPSVQGYALQPLPPGALVASLTGRNIADPEAVAVAIRGAVDRLGVRPRRAAVVIPDLAARVSLVRFDQVPGRQDDLDQLIRWQMKKAAPFPIEEAALTFTPGARSGAGSEFLVVAARRDIVHEYEAVCEDAGLHAGLVDLATLSVVNLFLAGESAPTGDWLLVHMRPEYTSIVIMRGEDVIFYRSRAEGDEDALGEVVHQTTMYYQDRLAGQGFSRVFLGGVGRTIGAAAAARQSLEQRLGARIEPIDPTRIVALTDRIQTSPELAAVLAPLVGMLLRTRRETVTA